MDAPTDTDTDSDAGQAPGPPHTDSEQRLRRAGHGRMVAGVAAGVADYFGVDPLLVRIGFVALALVGGLSVPLYLAGWLLIPEEGVECSVAEDLLGHAGSR